MTHLKVIKKYIGDTIKILEKALKHAKTARDNAPSAMESHSDETRSRMESQVYMLEVKLKEIKVQLDAVPNEVNKEGKIKLWNLVKISKNGQKELIVIVPNGLGGKKLKNLLLVSEESPYGKNLVNKKIGDTINFNSNQVKVISVN